MRYSLEQEKSVKIHGDRGVIKKNYYFTSAICSHGRYHKYTNKRKGS